MLCFFLFFILSNAATTQKAGATLKPSASPSQQPTPLPTPSPTYGPTPFPNNWATSDIIAKLAFDQSLVNYQPWHCNRTMGYCHAHCEDGYIMPASSTFEPANSEGPIDYPVIVETDSTVALKFTLASVDADGSFENSTFFLWSRRSAGTVPRSEYQVNSYSKYPMRERTLLRHLFKAKNWGKCLKPKKCPAVTYEGSTTTCAAGKTHCEYECDKPTWGPRGTSIGPVYGGRAFCDVKTGKWARVKSGSRGAYDSALTCAELKYMCIIPGLTASDSPWMTGAINKKSMQGCNSDRMVVWKSSSDRVKRTMEGADVYPTSGDKYCKYECDESYGPKKGCSLQNFTCVPDKLDAPAPQGTGKMLWKWDGPEHCIPECEYHSSYTPGKITMIYPVWAWILLAIGCCGCWSGVLFAIYLKCVKKNDAVVSSSYQTMN